MTMKRWQFLAGFSFLLLLALSPASAESRWENYPSLLVWVVPENLTITIPNCDQTSLLITTCQPCLWTSLLNFNDMSRLCPPARPTRPAGEYFTFVGNINLLQQQRRLEVAAPSLIKKVLPPLLTLWDLTSERELRTASCKLMGSRGSIKAF